ncbi:Syntaxin-binding protein [Dirofilaria immitis]
MDRAKRRLVSALDGFRNQHKSEMDLDEKITAENVCLTGIVRHGFPDDPRCMAYDTVQRLLAIGTGHGVIRIIGGIGVDYCLKHESDAAVLHIQFLMNEGALVTACYDDLIHLWNFRQKVPGVLHSIQLTKEQITCISHSFQNKWLYLGTERGNVYFINIATFTLSNYTINWNKAIDLGVRTHPGSVKAISTCPTELSKLLLLYEKGMVVLWNLQTKEVDRFISDHPARCFAWHHDGRQFMCGTADGFLLIWNTRKPEEYAQKLQPHGQKCSPITQVDWKHSSDGEQLIVFSGGMSLETDLLPALTIMRASKSVTVLELDHPLITFASLNASPYSSVSQQPSSVAILMKHDLLVIDLTIPGYPCHENVSPMDIHESRVRCIYYFSNCPLDLLGALALVGSKQRRQGFSNKPWPITGGNGRDCAMGHQELLLTGHEDGSIKFWQASGEHLQILYKLKSGRHFEGNEGLESHQTSHAVTMIELCLDSRLLLVAGQSGQLTLFRFVKTENAHEITVINIPSIFPFLSSNMELVKTSPKRELKRQGTAISVESNSTDTSEGYQPDLVCMIPWRNISQPETITAMALNSAYGIIALGTSMSLTLIDLVQYVIICSWSVADLYVSQHSTPILLSQNSNSSQYDCGMNTKRNMDSPPVFVSSKPILRGNTDISHLRPDRRPQLLKSQSIVDSGCEINDSSIAKTSSADESSSCTNKMVFSESVTSLTFIQSFIKKKDPRAYLCLWVGTSTSTCIIYYLLLPADRLNSTVSVAHSGSIVQTHGRVLYTTLMDQNFCLLGGATENYHEKESDRNLSEENNFPNKILTKLSLSPTCSNITEYRREDDFLQLAVLVSEDEVHAVALPNFNSLFLYRPEFPFIKARATHVHGYPVLMLLNGAGQIVILSLPSLRLLLCSNLFRHSIDYDDPLCLKTSFAEHGLGIYMITPSEIQKFTVCSELANQVQESAGELFVPIDTPEPPKNSFLKGMSALFISQKESFDLDTIFLDKNSNSVHGSSMLSIAKTIPGPSNMEQATARGVSVGQAANMALQISFA